MSLSGVIAACFVLVLFVNPTSAQTPFDMATNGTSTPVLSQQQIDAISSPAEGFQVFNSTTGCIHYYLNSTWFKLCGACLPETKPYSIDSIVQIGRNLVVYFRKDNHDTLYVKIKGAETKTWGISSPTSISVPATSDTVVLITSVANQCYSNQRQMEFSIKLNASAIGPVLSMDVEKSPIKTRSVGAVIWMCQDQIKTEKVKTKDRLVSFDSSLCPSGWRVPSVIEWEQLLSLYEGDPSEVFLAPEDANGSIGISKLGAWVVDEDALIQEGFSGYYWASDKAGSGEQFMVNITSGGYMIISGKAANARLNVRCVKDE